MSDTKHSEAYETGVEYFKKESACLAGMSDDEPVVPTNKDGAWEAEFERGYEDAKEEAAGR